MALLGVVSMVRVRLRVVVVRLLLLLLLLVLRAQVAGQLVLTHGGLGGHGRRVELLASRLAHGSVQTVAGGLRVGAGNGQLLLRLLLQRVVLVQLAQRVLMAPIDTACSQLNARLLLLLLPLGRRPRLRLLEAHLLVRVIGGHCCGHCGRRGRARPVQRLHAALRLPQVLGLRRRRSPRLSQRATGRRPVPRRRPLPVGIPLSGQLASVRALLLVLAAVRLQLVVLALGLLLVFVFIVQTVLLPIELAVLATQLGRARSSGRGRTSATGPSQPGGAAGGRRWRRRGRTGVGGGRGGRVVGECRRGHGAGAHLVAQDATYARYAGHVEAVADSFRHETVLDFPGENARILSLELADEEDHLVVCNRARGLASLMQTGFAEKSSKNQKFASMKVEASIKQKIDNHTLGIAL